MALTGKPEQHFNLLAKRLQDLVDDLPTEKSTENLHRLLLLARDEFEDDATLRLLNEYAQKPVTEITPGITRACRRVCKIVNGGGPSTGILVAPDLVLTTAHTMHGATTDFPYPDEVEVFFDEFRFSDGKKYVIKCGVAQTAAGQMRIVASSHDDDLDYVIFQLQTPIGLDLLGVSRRKRRGWMDLSTVEVAPEGKVIILQHPEGRPMKVSDGDIDPDTTGVPAGRFRYDTITAPGASGSAVVNQDRQLVGVHINETNKVEQLVSLTAIFRDLLMKNIVLPRYPPSETFREEFSTLMHTLQDPLAFT